MTIAEKRRKAIKELVMRKTAHPTQQDIDNARKAMNSYYRLCGIEERLLYLENNERTCNGWGTKRLEERRDKWFLRLNEIFKINYNAELVYFSYLPSICESGTTHDLYLTYFYN